MIQNVQLAALAGQTPPQLLQALTSPRGQRTEGGTVVSALTIRLRNET